MLTRPFQWDTRPVPEASKAIRFWAVLRDLLSWWSLSPALFCWDSSGDFSLFLNDREFSCFCPESIFLFFCARKVLCLRHSSEFILLPPVNNTERKFQWIEDSSWLSSWKWETFSCALEEPWWWLEAFELHWDSLRHHQNSTVLGSGQTARNTAIVVVGRSEKEQVVKTGWYSGTTFCVLALCRPLDWFDISLNNEREIGTKTMSQNVYNQQLKMDSWWRKSSKILVAKNLRYVCKLSGSVSKVGVNVNCIFANLVRSTNSGWADWQRKTEPGI